MQARRTNSRAQKVTSELTKHGEEEAPFEMANLFPRDTGLPMTVWVSPKGRARHDVRVKVCTAHGDRMDAANTVVVAVRPQPVLFHGELARGDFELVARWIVANRTALIDYWDGHLSTVEFVYQLKKI